MYGILMTNRGGDITKIYAVRFVKAKCAAGRKGRLQPCGRIFRSGEGTGYSENILQKYDRGGNKIRTNAIIK